MNKISDRFLKITSYINKGETLADIGTDHGYLPLYLYEQGLTDKAILTDLSQKSLGKAITNLQEYEGVFEYRLGSGLETLLYNEVDVIVIAGMGGNTIIDILEKDLIKTKSFNKIILQPRTAMIELRKWLAEKEIRISNEALAREGNRISEIIVTESKTNLALNETGNYQADLNEVDYEISPLLSKRDPLLQDFIEGKIKKTIEIKNSIKKHGRIDHNYKLKKIEDRIKILEGLQSDTKHDK